MEKRWESIEQRWSDVRVKVYRWPSLAQHHILANWVIGQMHSMMEGDCTDTQWTGVCGIVGCVLRSNMLDLQGYSTRNQDSLRISVWFPCKSNVLDLQGNPTQTQWGQLDTYPFPSQVEHAQPATISHHAWRCSHHIHPHWVHGYNICNIATHIRLVAYLYSWSSAKLGYWSVTIMTWWPMHFSISARNITVIR